VTQEESDERVRLVPPLKNGMPRVAYDQDDKTVSVLVTEDSPVFLLGVDSGLELQVEKHGYPHNPLGTLMVRAVRVSPAPQIVFRNSDDN
jgi:hypothetical protein